MSHRPAARSLCHGPKAKASRMVGSTCYDSDEMKCHCDSYPAAWIGLVESASHPTPTRAGRWRSNAASSSVGFVADQSARRQGGGALPTPGVCVLS
jgi:hypothetical protein